MTVTTIPGNQPQHFQAAQMAAAITAQQAVVASFANGSQFQNHAIQRLTSLQRAFVIYLMDENLLNPATILTNCTYGS